jgi:glycosyltransferase involved in cell wall biosynthesis
MRVLQYNWVFPPHPFTGGRANVCRYYSKFLAMRGHEVTVFTTKCKEAPVHAEENNFKIIRKGFCYSGNRVTDYVKRTFQQSVDYFWLKNHLKEFDVFHLHAPSYGIFLPPIGKIKKYGIFKGWTRAVRKSGVPLIIHFHGPIDVTNTKLVANYLSDARNAEKILTYCQETKQKLKELGIKTEIRVIFNGVDLQLFNPQKYPRKRKKFTVLYLSGKAEIKGYRYLMRAIEMLKRKSKADLDFVLLGPGLKNVPYVEMPFYFSQADIVVFPFLGAGLSLSMVEAMAMEKTVVVTDTGYIGEIIKHCENGFLIPPADANSLASAILKLYKDRELRKRMGLKGRKLVEEKFDIRKIILEIEQIYDKVVAR